MWLNFLFIDNHKRKKGNKYSVDGHCSINRNSKPRNHFCRFQQRMLWLALISENLEKLKTTTKKKL